MYSPILLTGGTGTLGRLVAPRLRDAGQTVRVLSRQAAETAQAHETAQASETAQAGETAQAPGSAEFVTGDLTTGEGIDAAVAGVGTIVHCAGTAKGDDDKTRTLVRAASRAGVEHLVYISVVGADRIPVVSRADRAMFGYFAAKRAAEDVVADSGLPWTTLRAAQFYDLVLTVARQLAKLPVMPVPAGVRYQPVDARDVADRLVELALGTPSGLVPDIAGPRVYGLDELIRGYLRAAHRRRLLMPVPLAGKAARAIRDGANLALAGDVGCRTWEAFLAERVGA